MIKNWFLFLVSLLLIPVALWFLGERLTFLSRAIRVDGEVSEVRATNGTCSSGKRRRKRSHSCTKFEATIDFTTLRGEQGFLEVSAGSARGHNQAETRASTREGAKVPVLYDPNNISNACRDYFMDKWGKPLMFFIAQLITMIGSLFEGKKGRGLRI
jgi:hypothetical protein